MDNDGGPGPRTSRSRRNTHRSSGRRDGSRSGDSSTSSAVVRKVRAGLTKKLAFFTDLMRHLDMIVFAELGVLYYMDCSLFRLLLRALAQTFFLSPKSEDFIVSTEARRPHLVAVLFPNMLCFILHLLAPLPHASEANRGYLHGGVMIDFIGQKAPTSVFGLLLLDLVVLAVQCLMLAVHNEREKVRKLVAPMRSSSSSTVAAAAVAAVTAAATTAATSAQATAQTVSQTAPAPASAPAPAANGQARDLDAEERDVGAQPQPGENGAAGGIELQPIRRDRASTGASAGGRRAGGYNPPSGAGNENSAADVEERLRSLGLGSPSTMSPEAAADSVLDALSSGSNLCDFYIVHTLRSASRESQAGTAAQSLQSLGYAVTLARLAAERSARARPAPRPAQ